MKKRQDMPGTDAPIPPAEMQRTELQARQIDLEIQNEELLQARDLLEESRDRYIDFYDFSPVGYLTLSHKALITEINLTGAVMLGEERSRLRRRRFAEFLALEDNDFWNRHFMAARQHEGKLTCELSVLRGDGSRMDVQIDSLRLARDSREPVVRLALTDITERKRAEAALRASEAQRRLLEQQKIIQTSLDGFWVARVKDAHILEANEAFCNMVGYAREELLTMSIYDLEADESPDETAAHIKRIMEIGYDRFETRHRHKQGHLIDIEVSVSYSESDGGVNVVFVRNITERKFSEQYERFRSHILELLSGDDSLPDILDGIVRGVEQLSHGVICSILLREGNRLSHGIAPSLPDFYNAAIEGVEIGIGIGSCGTAAATGERVIVADIQTHPYWASFKELAAKAGLGACWSQPILSSVGQVLGTFAIYHHEAHTPTAFDISIIEQAAHLASIAIERKLADQQLKQSLEFSEGIINAIPDILFEMDRGGTYLNVWTQSPELLAAQKQILLGKNVHEVLSPEAAAAIMDAIREADENGTSVGLDICIDLPLGKFWFSHSLAKKPGNTLSNATFMVLSRDITERKQAESLLMQRERELRTFAENMPDNIVRYNREGATIYVNPALERTLGDRAAAMIGTTPREYHPDGSFEDYAQLLDAVLASGEAGELEKILPGPDGLTFIHHIRMVPERGENGEVVGVLAVGRDITERKRSEEALRASEQQFRTLAENFPDILIRYDSEGRRTYINPAMERIFAVTAKQTIGLSPQEANPVELPGIYLQALEHTLATGERSEFEMELPLSSGDVHTGFIYIVAERAVGGYISGAITIGRDITKLKQTEHQLRELAAHLQSAREEEKAHLARELHDDLGQILFLLKFKVSGYTYDCAANSGALCEHLQEVLMLADRAIGTARNIVSALRPPALDYGIAAALKWLVENFISSMKIQCELQIEDEEIRLDESKSLALFRIVQEALNNVAKHAQADKVEIVLNKDATDCALSMRDNGTGFDTSKIKKGSFGLVGMHERALMHGGTVSIESRAGGGTEIVVRIPVD